MNKCTISWRLENFHADTSMTEGSSRVINRDGKYTSADLVTKGLIDLFRSFDRKISSEEIIFSLMRAITYMQPRSENRHRHRNSMFLQGFGHLQKLATEGNCSELDTIKKLYDADVFKDAVDRMSVEWLEYLLPFWCNIYLYKIEKECDEKMTDYNRTQIQLECEDLYIKKLGEFAQGLTEENEKETE